MSTIPAAGHISDSLRTEGEVKADLEATISGLKQVPGAAQVELTNTISGGSITPAGGGGVYVIDTEAAAATDDLSNIVTTNIPDGGFIMLRNANAARFVVVKSLAGGAGQVNLDRAADYTLDDIKKWLLIQRRGADWFEVFRGPQRLTTPVLAKSGTYTLAKEDHGKVINCTSTFTLSLLAAAAAGNGFTVSIVNNGTGLITIDPNSSELIDGVATLVLAPGFGSVFSCDGSAWYSATGKVLPAVVTVAFAASLTVDTALGNYFEIGNLTANVTTFTLSNPAGGHTITIRFKQDATGSRSVATPSGAKISGSIDGTASVVSHLTLTYSLVDTRWEGYWSSVPV